MTKFYTSAVDQIDYVQGISIVESIVANLKTAVTSPTELANHAEDFFGNPLQPTVDTTMKSVGVTKGCCSLRSHEGLFLQAHLQVHVLERQHSKYFECEMSDKLCEESRSSCTVVITLIQKGLRACFLQ